jgi:DNA-binding beta-propeller fold protein YncE
MAVADVRASGVFVLTVADGALVRRLGQLGRGNAPGQLSSPGGVAITPDDERVIVCDWGNHRLCVFGLSDGVLLGCMGSPGTELGQFNFPSAICCLRSANLIIVLEAHTQRVQVLDATTGCGVRQWIPQQGSDPGELDKPAGVCESESTPGHIYVTDMMNHRVVVFDTHTGQFIRSFGSIGSELGQIRKPFGIAVSWITGDVFVAEDGGNRISIFR